MTNIKCQGFGLLDKNGVRPPNQFIPMRCNYKLIKKD